MNELDRKQLERLVALRRLRAALVEHGIRQSEIADALGVTRQTVSAVLGGRSTSSRVMTYIKDRLAEEAA